ncbi:MAG: response regulator [Hyphomicrobiaceae bacterium]
MQQRTTDKRAGARSRMLKGGMIAFSGRHATIPCVVRDISEGGARLQVAQSSAVPDTFELIVELDGLEVSCLVVWRKLQEVGVGFVGELRRTAPKRAQVVNQTGPVARATLRRAAPLPSAPPTRSTPQASPVAPVAPLVTEPASAEPEASRPASAQIIRPKSAGGHYGPIPILIAEDDPDDRLLMRDAFSESRFTHPIAFVENGVELLQYVRGEPPFEGRPYPGLILLDLNMPKMDGRTALMHLKTDSTFKRIPVIVLTTSSAEDDIQRTYDLGVTAYVSKPGSHKGLLELVASLNDFWARFVSLPAA